MWGRRDRSTDNRGTSVEGPLSIRVSVVGATGWTGRAVAQGVLQAADMQLVNAVARSSAGLDLGVAWGREPNGVPVLGDVASAAAQVDVVVDYTSASATKEIVLAALSAGAGVVVGSSGMSGSDYEDVDAAARAAGRGVVAAGNFSVTAAMAKAAATLVAPFLPYREIIDFASYGKPDSPSGTARELAEALGEIGRAPLARPIDETQGFPEARGADVAGTQVHSVRLPGFVVSTEVVFAMPDERLVIRHDAGGTADPYVAGTLLAIRAVPQLVGLVRGLDTLLLDRP